MFIVRPLCAPFDVVPCSIILKNLVTIFFNTSLFVFVE